MANLRVFISSTCYDLGVIRSQLRNFISEIGFEPVMSDFSDVLFDPRTHTHISCLQEVSNCDLIILIIGSRYGGKAIPKVNDSIDLELLRGMSASSSILSDDSISITQAEVFKAIESKIPVFTFVDSGVYNDHLTYEKNKEKNIINDLEFPHVDRQDTARYIFEFINFMRHRVINNSLISFARFDDIENHLRRQWSALFQRLLHEQRIKEIEAVRIDYLSAQISDLKTAFLSSITNVDLKETAKGAIKYRAIIEFFVSIEKQHPKKVKVVDLLLESHTFEEVLSIIGIASFQTTKQSTLFRSVLILKDGTYFKTRLSINSFQRFSQEFEAFKQLTSTIRQAIINAVIDNLDMPVMLSARYVGEQFEETQAKVEPSDDDDDIPF